MRRQCIEEALKLIRWAQDNIDAGNCKLAVGQLSGVKSLLICLQSGKCKKRKKDHV